MAKKKIPGVKPEIPAPEEQQSEVHTAVEAVASDVAHTAGFRGGK